MHIPQFKEEERKLVKNSFSDTFDIVDVQDEFLHFKKITLLADIYKKNL